MKSVRLITKNILGKKAFTRFNEVNNKLNLLSSMEFSDEVNKKIINSKSVTSGVKNAQRYI